MGVPQVWRESEPLGPHSAARTNGSAPGTALALALAATVGLAAACWVITVRQMTGMDMGPATPLGSVAFFAAPWVPMMAAMMLPGAAPAALRSDRADGLRAVPLFVGSYLRPTATSTSTSR